MLVDVVVAALIMVDKEANEAMSSHDADDVEEEEGLRVNCCRCQDLSYFPIDSM